MWPNFYFVTLSATYSQEFDFTGQLCYFDPVIWSMMPCSQKVGQFMETTMFAHDIVLFSTAHAAEALTSTSHVDICWTGLYVHLFMTV